jgi:enoyl-CoA hydratase/carnithine racemase
MTDQVMTLEIRDGIGHVTLSQPDRGNPFDLEFCLQLSRIATECDENAQVRAVLIDAAGACFSVGADLKTLTRDRDELPSFIKNATVGLHSAAEALEYGLVSDVLDDADLSQAAWDLAAELARGPTRSFGEIKNLLLSTWEQPIEAQMELEARAMARVCRTEDAWTGIREVAARRIPEFRGR